MCFWWTDNKQRAKHLNFVISTMLLCLYGCVYGYVCWVSYSVQFSAYPSSPPVSWTLPNLLEEITPNCVMSLWIEVSYSIYAPMVALNIITLLQPNSTQRVWYIHYKPQAPCATFLDLGKHDMNSTVSQTFQMMPILPFCFSGALLCLLIQRPKKTKTK